MEEEKKGTAAGTETGAEGQQAENNKNTEKGTNNGNGAEEKKNEVNVEEEKKKWLKEMGFEDEDEDAVKEIAKKHRQEKESKMTEEQKANNNLLKEKSARIAAEKEAANSKAMVKAMKLGAKPDYVEEVIALVMAKTGGKENEFDSAFGEVKKKCPFMFTDGEQNDDSKNKKGMRGTGSSLKGKEKNGEGKEESIGERLAKMRSASKKKSVYFK